MGRGTGPGPEGTRTVFDVQVGVSQGTMYSEAQCIMGNGHMGTHLALPCEQTDKDD